VKSVTIQKQNHETKKRYTSQKSVVFASFLAIVFFLPSYFVIQITMKGGTPPAFT